MNRASRTVAQVAVVGPGDAEGPLLDAAQQVGALLARHGAVVVTGGLAGVMAAACRGARESGGRTVGVLPGTDPANANEWVDIAIPTGLGEGRDALVVAAADGVIAVGGSWGTLAEVALALRAGKPVVGLWTWSVLDAGGVPLEGVEAADDPAHAVRRLLAQLVRQPLS